MDLIFVHGALVRDGDWWWRPTAELLGMRSRALVLPSCEGAGGLADDAAALRSALDDSDGAIVVGHSYGGTVIAEAGQHPAVSSLVFISSYLPEIGQTHAEITASDDPPTIALDGDRLRLDGYDEQSFGARFLQDRVDAVAAAMQRLAHSRPPPSPPRSRRPAGRVSTRPTSSARRTAAPPSSCSGCTRPGPPAASTCPPGTTRSSRGPTSWLLL